MALENLEPATRIESILDGEDIAPATRLEYFLKQAAAGGGGGGISLLEQSAPFYVPDLVNGGTRLLDPSDVSLEIWASVNNEYIRLNENAQVYFSEISPPLYVEIADVFALSISWENVPVTTKENNLYHPAYAVNTGYFVSVTLLGRSDKEYILVVNPNDVVYMNTTDK